MSHKEEPTKQEQPSHQESKHNNKTQHAEHQVKQMRRIHEKQQMPTDKAQLIQYLSQRIKQAEQALDDTEQILEIQIKQREEIAKSIDERNSQLQKLYQIDQKALPQKIKERLTQILTETINQKLQAEQLLQEQKSKNYQFKARYNELKWEQQQSKYKLDELGKKQANLNSEISNFEVSIDSHEKELKELEEEFQLVKEKKQTLEDKYLQMKVALERMTDIKAVLNRFFGNQDLFDEKMDLKEQKVTRPPIIPIQEQHPSETRIPSRQNRNITKLKPLNNSRRRQTGDDQDFWKGDFAPKTRNS